MPRNAPATPPLLAFLLLVPFASACGGKIAAEEPSPAAVPAPTAVKPSAPSLAEYCEALQTSQCGDNLCVSEAECRRSYSNASDAFLRAVIECRREGKLSCGYPDTCVFERIGTTTATRAQVEVANVYCSSCFPDVDENECRTAVLRPEGEAPSFSFGLRALADAAAEGALQCATTPRLPSSYCPGDFFTCIAKFRPIAAYTDCRREAP